MARYVKELPQDAAGQKTTAIPREEAASAEWVTPVSDNELRMSIEAMKAHIETTNLKLQSMESKMVDVMNGTASNSTKIVGGSAKEPFNGSTDVTHTFTQTMRGFVITNDGLTDDITVTIDGGEYLVRAGETFIETFEPFTVVEIKTTSPYRAYGKL